MPDGSLHPMPPQDAAQNAAWHRQLALFNAKRFAPALPGPDWQDDIAEHAAMSLNEGAWLEAARAAVADRAAQDRLLVLDGADDEDVPAHLSRAARGARAAGEGSASRASRGARSAAERRSSCRFPTRRGPRETGSA